MNCIIRFTRHPTVVLILRLFLGGVFVYASWDKLCHPAGFAEAVYRYRILPEILVNPVAILVPWLELLAGILLISGLFLRGALLVSTGLLATFLAALGFNLVRGMDVDCGCFSVSAGKPATYLTLARDGMFFLF
ncbi:MAG: MauE/DoxX family redox-associated membrane protein, partial [Pseudomonadota bacterium]